MRYRVRSGARLAILSVALLVFVSLGAAAPSLEIQSVSHPSQVTAGESLEIDVTVENTGSDADDMELRVEAFGLTERVEDLDLDGGETDTFTITVEIPTNAKGTEDFQVEARALTSGGSVQTRAIDTISVTIKELAITMRLSPDRVVVGEPVEIHGMMNSRDIEADLLINGGLETTIRPDPTRSYSHTIVPDQEGFYSIQLRAGSVRETKYLRVLPELGILQLNVPETANTKDRFRVCADLFRSTYGQTDVRLEVDGNAVDQRSIAFRNEREECFTTQIREAGEHSVTVVASSGGATARKSQPVNIVESRIEVNVFPQDLTLAPNTAGLFEVQVHNRDASARTFQIRLSGLDGMAETTQQQVALGGQESRTVFVRVVPPETGRHTGRIQVTADGTMFADTDVRVFATASPKLKSGLSASIDAAISGSQSFVAANRFLIAAVIGLLVAIAAVLYVRRGNSIMEPRY